MNDTCLLIQTCPFCGRNHTMMVRQIKAINYHPGGSIKRIEYYPVEPTITGRPIDDILDSLPIERKKS